MASQEDPAPGVIRKRGSQRGTQAESSSESSSVSSVCTTIKCTAKGNTDVSPPDSPTIRSPTKFKKAKGDRQEEDSNMEESITEPSNQIRFEQFPSSSNPVTMSNMKDMLISLRDFFHIDMLKMLKPIKDDVQELEHRMTYTKHNMEDAFSDHNNLVDAYKEQQNELQRMAAKLTDMEDRSRRNNITFCGIPESIPNADLSGYIYLMLRTLLPKATDIELTIDRVT